MTWNVCYKMWFLCMTARKQPCGIPFHHLWSFSRHLILNSQCAMGIHKNTISLAIFSAWAMFRELIGSHRNWKVNISIFIIITVPANGLAKPSAGKLMVKFASHIDGLVQEKRNSSALAMELRLSCTNPSICILTCNWRVKSCATELFRETMKIYLHFLSFLNTELEQVVEIFPHGWQGSMYPA